MAAHQAPPSLGFSRQEHWSGLPFPSPMHESEKWKWSHWVVSNSQRPMDCSPPGSSIHGIFQARVLEWGAIAFSDQLFKFMQITHGSTSIYYALTMHYSLLMAIMYWVCMQKMAVNSGSYGNCLNKLRASNLLRLLDSRHSFFEVYWYLNVSSKNSKKKKSDSYCPSFLNDHSTKGTKNNMSWKVNI